MESGAGEAWCADISLGKQGTDSRSSLYFDKMAVCTRHCRHDQHSQLEEGANE